jgi:hypothetical protein
MPKVPLDIHQEAQMRRRAFSMIAVALLCASRAGAQELAQTLAPGTPVRVKAFLYGKSEVVEGRLVALGPDTVRFTPTEVPRRLGGWLEGQLDSARVLVLPMFGIRRFEAAVPVEVRKRRTGRGVAFGAVLGLFGGALVGAGVGAAAYPEWSGLGAGVGAVVGAPTGVLLGMAIGAGVGGGSYTVMEERWFRVDITPRAIGLGTGQGATIGVSAGF